MMMKRGTLGVAVLMASMWACEGDEPVDGGGVTAPTNVVVRQERIDAEQWSALAGSASELGELASGRTFVGYGVTEDSSGVVVTWAEADDASAVVYFCESPSSCVAASQNITGAGDLEWRDASGAEVPPKSIGKPTLLKNLQGNDLSGKTVLALELDAADLPDVDLAKRQIYILNTFGPALGLNLEAFESAARKHAGFDEVVAKHYVRHTDVLPLLTNLDGMDAVVWLSQGVRQEVVTGTSYKTVGLTVNRAAFGEATLSFQELGQAAEKNVTRGPGLLVLAASNSYSDGSADQPGQGSVWQTLDDGERTLVGLQGHADVNRVTAAVTTFLDLYLSGDVGLADALDQANRTFAGTGALLRTNQANGLKTYLRQGADVWANAGLTPPTSGRVTTYIAATPYCDGQPQNNSFASAWADVTFDGGFFEGTRATTVDPTYSTDTHVRGVVTGLEPGDAILIEFWGDLDKAVYQDTYGFGEGIITSVETLDDGSIEIAFDGEVHATPYADDMGRTCIWNTPQLTTTTSAPSKLVLTP